MTRRIALLLAAATAVAAVLALILSGVIGGSDSPPDGVDAVDPRFEALPEPRPQPTNASLRYLRGEGSPLLVMHQTALVVVGDASRGECRAVIDKLDTTVPSDDVVGLAAGVADLPLQEAFLTERKALGVVLTTCVQARERLSSAAAELVAARELVKARLGQLENAT